MARSLMYSVSNDSFSPPFVQHDPNSVFVIVFSSSHEDVFVMCLPYFSQLMPPRIIHENRVHLYPLSSVTDSSIFSLECIDLMFF